MGSSSKYTFDEDENAPVRISGKRFETRTICDSFISDWEHRIVYYERVDDGRRMLLDDLYNKVKQRDWGGFLNMPSKCNQSIVREFYASVAHIESFETATVRVRGVKIRFDPGFINSYLKTFDMSGDFFQFNPITKPKFLRSVAHSITYEGDFVADCAGNIIGFPVDHLRLEANYLRLSVVHRLLPPLQSYMLTVEQGLLLYALLNNDMVNIGQLIHREIKRVAKTTNNEGLPYGCLICTFARNAGVKSEIEDVRYD